MKLRGALFAAGLMALPMVANAQPVNGLYIHLGVGPNFMHDQHVESVGGIATPGTRLSQRVGIAALGAVGWGFGNGLRAELEFDYRWNKFDSVSGAFSGSVAGSEQKFGPMVNVYYDFVDLAPGFTPYVGLGAGYQWSHDKGILGSTSASDTRGAVAYQAILGAAIPIDAVPGLAITAEYRFMGLAGDRTFRSGGFSTKLDHDLNHSVLLGVRYAFGAPAPAMAAAPAAAPAPAVQPARSYLVFFDWDKATLTDRARQIIREAADNSTHVQYTRIEVNGYTDTSGTPQYNQGLSIRRASAVKAELIKDGVPAGAITTQGFGETHLLVPTADGVREPQNRRVEIIIR